MQDYQQAWAYVAALTQVDPSVAIIDARMIHDQRKDIPAIPLRGTLEQLWSAIVQYNNQGYGAFVNISDMDGAGRETANVRACRVQVADLDSPTAEYDFQRINSFNPPPQFGVQTSPGKYHAYWSMPYYTGNDVFTLRQRKLLTLFNGDRKIIDSARVLRLPGTYHQKAEPFLVRVFTMSGYGQVTDHGMIDAALAHVHVTDGGSGERHELGDPSLAAPSLEWLQRAMDLTDPNGLDRLEWVSFMAAVKQAGWSLTDESTLRGMFDRWCARYEQNDLGENEKQWSSIRNTEVGWPSLKRRVPQMGLDAATVQQPNAPGLPDPASLIQPPPLDCSGEMLTYLEQQQYFAGCVFVTELSKIMTHQVRFLNSTQFNAEYGGKLFIWTSAGKSTDEAWKAATRGTQFKVPIVDHTRFVPARQFMEIIHDDLGRKGVNIYKPASVARVKGDPSPFLRHIGFMLPDQNDQKILLDYLAHNIKYPGYKIPWAPVIQSVEGVGKGIIKAMIKRCVGNVYFHAPNAKDLAEGGQKFNAWMRAKLFILADEIKVDEARDMIEVLKPMISEEEIEVQGKGVDQKIEDNYANWMFFTNYKNAVPINKNSRRFCIFYSAFQSKEQLEIWGLGKTYFDDLYRWMKADGAAIMYDYFMSYDLAEGAIPMRAPDTSSTPEVIKHSTGPVERMINEAVADGVQGFRGGWVSSTAVRKRMTELGLRQMSIAAIEKILIEMDYREIGRSVEAYIQEDRLSKSTLFNRDTLARVEEYGPLQGYM